MRSLPSAYTSDVHIKRMVTRLARGTITDEKAEWLARAVHKQTGWAGRPVAFDDNGKYRPVGSKEQDIAVARSVLETAKAAMGGGA
jgi:hypothetical protein